MVCGAQNGTPHAGTCTADPQPPELSMMAGTVTSDEVVSLRNKHRWNRAEVGSGVWVSLSMNQTDGAERAGQSGGLHNLVTIG